MDKLKPIPYATHCRCGHGMPKGATARYDKAERLYYDCHLCRPRPQPKPPALIGDGCEESNRHDRIIRPRSPS